MSTEEDETDLKTVAARLASKVSWEIHEYKVYVWIHFDLFVLMISENKTSGKRMFSYTEITNGAEG